MPNSPYVDYALRKRRHPSEEGGGGMPDPNTPQEDPWTADEPRPLADLPVLRTREGLRSPRVIWLLGLVQNLDRNQFCCITVPGLQETRYVRSAIHALRKSGRIPDDLSVREHQNETGVSVYLIRDDTTPGGGDRRRNPMPPQKEQD